ncbi:MAG: trigger factor family protein, partial [Bacteroides sp.]
MNISGENSTKLANVHTIRLEFAPADYTEKYNKEIKTAARNLELPGFRKGHVPALFHDCVRHQLRRIDGRHRQ